MTLDEALHRNAELGAQVQRFEEDLKVAQLTIEKLKVEVAYLRRMKYGRSSERLEHEQLELVGSQLAPVVEGQKAADTSNVASLDEHRKKRAYRPRPNLRDLPEHLPRRTVMHLPAGHQAGCGCPACGLALREIGQDVSEVLDYEPGSFHVVRHVRPKLACSSCKDIKQAAAPSRPIERVMAGAGLLAHVLVSKYSAVWFQYSVDRKGEHPDKHLKKFSGVLQADAFAGYNALYDEDRKGGRIIEAGCWSHARRKVWDIHVRQHKLAGTLAHQALERMSELFKIEAEIHGKPPSTRRRIRQEHTGPLLEDLQAWMKATLTQVSAKSPMALAIGYALSNWTALTRFADDGGIEAHNNAAERALRGVALGRKNYLHLGSDVGGNSAAVIYTLIGSAKLNGIDPQRYLSYVMERIAEHQINRIDELLPWVVAPQLRAAWHAPVAEAA